MSSWLLLTFPNVLQEDWEELEALLETEHLILGQPYQPHQRQQQQHHHRSDINLLQSPGECHTNSHPCVCVCDFLLGCCGCECHTSFILPPVYQDSQCFLIQPHLILHPVFLSLLAESNSSFCLFIFATDLFLGTDSLTL